VTNEAIASSDISPSRGNLPREEDFRVIGPASRLQTLSAALVTAIVFGVHPAIEDRSASVKLVTVDNATTTPREVSSKQAVREALNQPIEELADGMTLGLGAKLIAGVQDYRDSFLTDLATTALRGEAHPEALSHALRWIGRLLDPQSFQERLLVLIRALDAPSTIVRDGAGLGLVELGSASALPALEAAVRRERNASLREDLARATGYLRSKS